MTYAQFLDRFRAVLKAKKCRVTALSRATGHGSTWLTQILNNGKGLLLEDFLLVCQEARVDPARVLSMSTDSQRDALMNAWDTLDRDGRARALAVVEALAGVERPPTAVGHGDLG